MTQTIPEYWEDNPKRWKRVLLRAAGIADMYELRRPDYCLLRDKIPSVKDLEDFRDGMWWKTTHRQITHKTGCGEVITDPLDTSPDFDPVTAWSCTVGLLYELEFMSVSDIRFTLGTSAGRQHYGWGIWREYTEDFRKQIRCLSGDLNKKGLRELVLGK